MDPTLGDYSVYRLRINVSKLLEAPVLCGSVPKIVRVITCRFDVFAVRRKFG